MNAPLKQSLLAEPDIAHAVAQACDRIAPSWPLDRSIAVNPHWGWIDEPIAEAAARLSVLGGARMLQNMDVNRQPLLADLAGQRETVVHQISQHCAAVFDTGQATWKESSGSSLFASWRERLASDLGLFWPQGRLSMLRCLANVPQQPLLAIAHAVRTLQVPGSATSQCLIAWLLDLNGWAAACAWRRWQARLSGSDDHWLMELLAIRATWDLLLAESMSPASLQAWAASWIKLPQVIAGELASQMPGWQRLLDQENEFQTSLQRSMSRAPIRCIQPIVQAVFCIDVRSEVLRRALEAQDARIATRGFAGFFGLPVDYQPLGTGWHQPQLPGLLPPKLTVREQTADKSLGEVIAQRRRTRLSAKLDWKTWRSMAANGFSFVESCGLLSVMDLMRDSLSSPAPAVPWQQAALRDSEATALHPVLADLDAADAIDLAHSVLKAMGLTYDFAPLLLLCGHGGHSANNPHAAGLDCGACGGQSGAVNARALAALLNDPAVRVGLRQRGVDLPQTTHVLAGLHQTTTDDVMLFDTEDVPASLAPALADLRRALAGAADTARAERAPGLGLPPMPAAALARALRERANHWAETRPEWALANNAAFIAAPRSRTLGLNLGGRVFLHDYEHAHDAENTVLTLILTAPMVVAHWINLQYLTSTVDPHRHGAGNKLLHNVVGAGVGVFEGNGGDLRIGLPWQSVHDGEQLRHTPLRLSVYVQAPCAAIDSVISRHETVRRLVDNGWLHLLSISADEMPVFHRRQPGGGWTLAQS